MCLFLVVAACGCTTYKQTVVLSVSANDPALYQHQPHTTNCMFPATAKAEVRWENK